MNCSTCKYLYRYADTKDSVQFCALMSSTNGQPLNETYAYALDSGKKKAIVLVDAAFGCVMYESTQTLKG